jgi:hypothetical protein
MNRKHLSLVSAGLSFLLLALSPLPAGGQKSLEIPSGTSIRVRMIDSLSSEKAQVGDTFRGTLDEAMQQAKQLHQTKEFADAQPIRY